MGNSLFCTWWNVENLFDVEDSPDRPEWLQKKLKRELVGWNDEVLNRKIGNLATVIMGLNDNRGPDLLGLCEIENRNVLDRIVTALNPLNRDYSVVHHDMSDLRGIDIAFLYDRSILTPGEQFNYVVQKRNETRDIFQVNFTINESEIEFVVIGNHWPSRSMGQFQSEPYRIIAAETLSYWIERIEFYKGKDIPILVMGDFNDEPHDRSMTDYALSSRNSTQVLRSRIPRLYNLMWPALSKGQGTYIYSSAPYILDQFLVNKNFLKKNSPLKIDPKSATIETAPVMTKRSTYMTPIKFGRPATTFNPDGTSDHFPIALPFLISI